MNEIEKPNKEIIRRRYAGSRATTRDQESGRISVDRSYLIVPDLDQVPARVEEVEVLARAARAAAG